MKKFLLLISAVLFGTAAFGATPALSESDPGELAVARRNGKLYLRNRFSATQDLVTELLPGLNGQVEVSLSRKIPAGIGVTADAMTRGQVVYHAADEGSPLLTTYGYVGANHGALTALTLTVPQHGFTDADIGSTPLKAGNRTYYILQVIDPNTLLVMSENIGRGGIGFFDRSSLRKEFSAKGKTFTAQKILHTQLFPNVRMKKQQYLLDGAPLPAGEFIKRGKSLTCDEIYEVVSPAALLEFVLKNPGRKVDPADPAVAAALEITNRYTFTPDGTAHLKQKVKFLEKTSLRQYSLCQP